MEGDCEETSSRPQVQHHQIHDATPTLPNGKKTKGLNTFLIENKMHLYLVSYFWF